MEILRPAFVALGLFGGGCGFIREPAPLAFSDEQIVVHSLLHAGSDTVSVLLQRMRLLQGSTVPTIRPVSGADVRITGATGELRLREAPIGFRRCGPLDAPGADPNRAEAGCYAAVLSGGVRAGGRYVLNITSPGGSTILGMAVVPETPTLLSPGSYARFALARTGAGGYDQVGEVPVRWRVAGIDGDVQVSVRADAAFRDGKLAQGTRCDVPSIESPTQFADSQRTDSAFARFFVPGCSIEAGRPVVNDSIHARLLITAYDTAYSRFHKLGGMNETVREQQASAGVSGALGVFGGAATAERQITLIPTR